MPVGFPDKEVEKRQSRRYPAWISNGRGALQVGDRRLPVRLFDHSAGGFGVIAAECPEISRGDIIQLHLDSEVFETRVMYVGEELSGGPPCSGTSYRIGLKRVKEFLPQDQPGPTHRSWLAAMLGTVHSRYCSTSLGAGLALALVVACMPVVFTVLFHHFADQSSDEWTAEAQATERPGTRPGDAASRSSPSDQGAGWPSFARLPGASVFLAPSVIQDLGLTETQQQQIRRIVEKTEQAFQRLDVRLQRMSRQGQSRSRENLLQAARQEALDSLTPEQRRKYEGRVGPEP